MLYFLFIIASYAAIVQNSGGTSFSEVHLAFELHLACADRQGGGTPRLISPAETSESPVVPRTVSISNSILSHQLNLYENSDLQNETTLEEWLAGLCIHLN